MTNPAKILSALACGMFLIASGGTAGESSRVAPTGKSQPTTRPAPKAQDAQLKLNLPRPLFEGTLPNLKKYKMRPAIKTRKILVPKGLKLTNLALKRPVTGSDEEPIIGELELITDGDKEGHDGSFVELGPNLQWVQIDLGGVREIFVILLWHYHREGRIYRDVMVQVSNDRDFITNVCTVFNNDHDNSAGLGIGKDSQYVDDYHGEVLLPNRHVKGVYAARRPVRARYVRFYSNGNTSNDLNHYTEVEIYGTLER